MNVVRRLNAFLLGKGEEVRFEDKVVLSCILYSGILCFISIFGNIGLKLNTCSSIVVGLFFIIYSVAYILGRFCKKQQSPKLIFTISSFVFCDALWLYNYGSRGAAMYIFLAYYSAMIFIWDNSQVLLISILVVANIIFLFCFELIYPGYISAYPSEVARISDGYSSLLIFIGVFALLALSAKHNYVKQFKKAQQSDQLKSAFLMNISHEIRTPLNAIMGFSYLLTTRELSPERKERYSQLITENGNYLMTLVSEILDVSLIDSGQFDISVNVVELNALFQKLYDSHEYLVAEKGKGDLKLLLQIPEQEVFIRTDGGRLEQVMVNLLSNAVKFTKEGFIKFGFQMEASNVLFFVEDSGIGIKPEFQAHVFDRFVKNSDNVESAFARGAGLGLSLSKQLVHLLQGEIWVTSEYMTGSTFAFILPVKMN